MKISTSLTKKQKTNKIQSRQHNTKSALTCSRIKKTFSAKK